MYQLLDILLTMLHLVIIGFNLLGWIFKGTRKLHLFVITATAASWLLLGIWYGIGYCPITDWQWQVKEHLGEHNLPNSFIKYFADKIMGTDISAPLIDTLTALVFGLAVAVTIYVNFIEKPKTPNQIKS